MQGGGAVTAIREAAIGLTVVLLWTFAMFLGIALALHVAEGLL